MKQLRATCCVLTAVLVVGACGDDDEAGIREGASGMLADSAVLAAMRDTGSVNRIIYDPAPDLSLASAQQRRPEIFRPPPPATPRPAALDTTKSRP
jgi:hypothetical protein